MQNIAIIGSGSWGTALAVHLANLGNNIKIWSFEEEEARIINNRKMQVFTRYRITKRNILFYKFRICTRKY